MPQVVIDPGHGGREIRGRSTPYGARAGSTWEKDLNLRLAERVVAHLGGDAALTRSGDVNLPLGDRAALARASGARAFVSLHGHTGRDGSEVYVHSRSGGDSRALADLVGRELGSTYGRPAAPSPADLAVLHPEALGGGTAACLVECAYHDGDRLLRDPAGLDRLGAAIARGVRAFLGGGLGGGPAPRGGYGRATARALVTPGSYTIPGPAIVPIRQPSSMQCWATVYTMLVQWRDRFEGSMDICNTVGAVGQRYSSLCTGNSVLPWAEIEPFAVAGGLIAEPAATYTFDAWVEMLATYGPLWVDYSPSQSAGPTHSVIVYGIETDGTPAGSTAYIVDPATGTTTTEPWPQFQARHDARLEAVGHAWPQIFHWPRRMGGVIGGYGRAVARRLTVTPGSYSIRQPAIMPIQQPTGMVCWATTYTMMRQWRDRAAAPLVIRDTVQSVSADYGSRFDNDNGMAWSDLDRFTTAGGLSSEPAASYTLTDWVSFVQTYGPLWVSYFPGADPATGGPTHAVILVGIETDGDETGAGTTMYVADPAVGQIVPEPFSQWATRYENRVRRVGIPYPQIFHWPAGYQGHVHPAGVTRGASLQPRARALGIPARITTYPSSTNVTLNSANFWTSEHFLVVANAGELSITGQASLIRGPSSSPSFILQVDSPTTSGVQLYEGFDLSPGTPLLFGRTVQLPAAGGYRIVFHVSDPAAAAAMEIRGNFSV